MISSVKAGKSCIYLAGAANVDIRTPNLRNGDYGINAAMPVRHVYNPVGNGCIVTLPYYNDDASGKPSQFIGRINDPFGYVTVVSGK